MVGLLPALSVAPKNAGAQAAAAAVARKLRRVTCMLRRSRSINDSIDQHKSTQNRRQRALVPAALSRGQQRSFLADRLRVRELQPEAHHLFVAGLAPTNGFRRIGILSIVERIVEIR